MLSLYYYNKVEIASVFHIHTCRMLKTYHFLHHHPRRGRACPARAPSGQHPLTHSPPCRGRACPASNLPVAARYCFAHPVSPRIVGSGLDRSACPFSSLRRGGIYAARNLATACRQSSTTHHPIICAHQPPSPQYTPCPNFSLKLCRKNQKTCKNLLTKGMPVAIIIKLSREPSPRRQPLEPLPTACTPFFEENFFKKLSENLLTNERI